jgi:hypothetical protein
MRDNVISTANFKRSMAGTLLERILVYDLASYYKNKYTIR